MMRLGLLTVLAVGLATAPAQSPPPLPKIDLSATGGSTGPGTGTGSVTASGSLTIPTGWQLSIHVVTVRFAKQGGNKTLNALIPVKGANFSATVDLKSGSYKVWAVIDVKDADGREQQISSPSVNVNIQ